MTKRQIILKSIVFVYNRDEKVSINELCRHSNLSLIQVMETLRELIDANILKFSTMRDLNFEHTAYMRRGKTYKPVKYFNS